MTQITYDGEYGLTIKGHAQYAARGKDIVCAAISALSFSLATKLEKDADKISDADVRFEEEATVISCTPKEGYRDECRGAYDVVLEGFKQMARAYPKNVTYIQQG